MSDTVLAALITTLGTIVCTLITALVPLNKKIIKDWLKKRRRATIDGTPIPPFVITNWPQILMIAIGAAALLWLVSSTRILPWLRPPICDYATTSGQGKTESIPFVNCHAEKIHIDLIKRALPGYGYSLWEVQAYESTCAAKPPSEDLVAGVTAAASSVENGAMALYMPNFAVDGYMSTRWSSAFSDPQSLEIPLDSSQVGKPINCVVLNWENAFAVEYKIHIVKSPSRFPWYLIVSALLILAILFLVVLPRAKKKKTRSP
jgi:hypothetical protein